MTTTDSDEPRTRDRGRTETAIIAAAKLVLAEEGFQGFGVNAVARRAGCDKQLLYRYFGGLDGLVDAIGDDLATWITATLGTGPVADAGSYGALMERLLLGFLKALRSDMLVQKIAAWEIAAPSALVARLADARGQALGRWIAAERGTLEPPSGIDAAAINAILIAALQHLVLSASTTGQFAGVALNDDAAWKRVEAAALILVRAVYGSPDGPVGNASAATTA